MTALLVLLQPRGPVFWYLIGAFHTLWIALAIGMVGVMWLASSQKAVQYLRGALGEDNTTDVLKAAQRNAVWGFVTGMETGGGDIDHLVVTRSGGVLAIDSKWSNQVTAELLETMATSARKAARRAESIMRSEHVGTLKRERGARHRADTTSYTVRPVVVVWGAEGHRMPDTVTRTDVAFVAGPRLAQWLRSLEGQVVEKTAATDLLNRLTGFRDR
ncbi:nuclease-related domain-containing protein [Nocardioides sp. URHA0020]|uniref:nuclease-related domain-containing protein n=1 Tax=Nocardioides sp. URHA0020 TaxID=1380392 RepID=UPI00048E6B9A|nr:nuclease-related domain-containing protein [Nocardioides sp. URHA0020]